MTNSQGVPVCGAQRRNETACMSTVICHPSGRCRSHGGSSPRGVARADRVSLRDSTSMPSHLQQALDAALEDPEIMALRHEIALTDVNIDQMKRTLGSEMPDTATLKSLVAEVEAIVLLLEADAGTSQRPLRMLQAFSRNLASAYSERRTFREIHEVSEIRRRLSETEQKRIASLRASLNGEQVIALAAAIANVVKENIHRTLGDIDRDYTLTSRSTGRPMSFLPTHHRNNFQVSVTTGIARLVAPPPARRDPNLSLESTAPSDEDESEPLYSIPERGTQAEDHGDAG